MKNKKAINYFETELRSQLNKEFMKRCERNSSYSLRSYARALSVDPTLLSRLMKGERRITQSMGERLMREINIPLQKVNKLLRIVSNESKNSEKKINNKEFALISKWYFFAILDLFLLDNFVNDKVWMAKKVGLKMTEFNAAFQTLVDNGHIDEVDGEFRVISQSTAWVNTKKTTRDRQNYQKQILEKAKEAVDTESFDRRENASLTLAANSNIIPEIKKKIQIFKDELREFIEEQGEYDEVYQLSVNFFPLTKVIN